MTSRFYISFQFVQSFGIIIHAGTRSLHYVIKQHKVEFFFDIRNKVVPLRPRDHAYKIWYPRSYSGDDPPLFQGWFCKKNRGYKLTKLVDLSITMLTSDQLVFFPDGLTKFSTIVRLKGQRHWRIQQYFVRDRQPQRRGLGATYYLSNFSPKTA